MSCTTSSWRRCSSGWTPPLTLLAQVGRPWLAAVVDSGLPRAGKGGAAPLVLREFVGSVKRLAWAKNNGCLWVSRTFAEAAASGGSGRLEVLGWALEHGCPCDAPTSWEVPLGAGTSRCWCGRESTVLPGAYVHLCPPPRAGTWRRCSVRTGSTTDCGTQTASYFAARGWNLEPFQWAREHGAPSA